MGWLACLTRWAENRGSWVLILEFKRLDTFPRKMGSPVAGHQSDEISILSQRFVCTLSSLNVISEIECTHNCILLIPRRQQYQLYSSLPISP